MRVYFYFFLATAWLTANKPLMAQGLDRHFYYQIAPNLSFGTISSNHPKLSSAQQFIPFFGLGVGYFYPVAERLYVDAAFDLHGTYYRVNSLPAPTGSSGFSPMLRASLCRFFSGDNEKVAFVPQVGAALAYSFEEQESVRVMDTVTDDEFFALQHRVDGFTAFAQAGLGLFLQMEKRNLLISLVYSQGLLETYRLNMSLMQEGNEYRSEFTAKDTYLCLQIKIFLKNSGRASAPPIPSP